MKVTIEVKNHMASITSPRTGEVLTLDTFLLFPNEALYEKLERGDEEYSVEELKEIYYASKLGNKKL